MNTLGVNSNSNYGAFKEPPRKRPARNGAASGVQKIVRESSGLSGPDLEMADVSVNGIRHAAVPAAIHGQNNYI